MFELLGRPLLAYVIDNLKLAGIHDLIIVTGPDSDEIRDYFEDGGALG
jgi:NDP-sugar pyrophosphorylase family protein